MGIFRYLPSSTLNLASNDTLVHPPSNTPASISGESEIEGGQSELYGQTSKAVVIDIIESELGSVHDV